MYNCLKCKTELIRGAEFQFPPRLSYWYCPKCQEVYAEHEGAENTRCIVYVGNVENYKSECIQDWNSRGFIENTITGEKFYPNNLPELKVEK